MKYLVLFFIFASIIFVQGENCTKENEEHKCGNSCSEKCGADTTKGCTRDCTLGCYCKKNFARNRHGKCIPKEKCTKAETYGCTKKNEIFQQCRSACPPTCSNMYKRVMCIMSCQPAGCACKTGTIRNSKNECVLPTKCTENEVTCPNNMIFNQKCRKSKRNCLDLCGCDKKQFLDKGSNKCLSREELTEIKTKECQTKDPNRIYSNENLRICLNGTPTTSPSTSLVSKHKGCFCKRGFYEETKTKKCLSADECRATNESKIKTEKPEEPETGTETL